MFKIGKMTSKILVATNTKGRSALYLETYLYFSICITFVGRWKIFSINNNTCSREY